MKKVMVTSGGTREYIDDVRVLTNISTGKLGAIIANRFLEEDFEVHYVAPSNAVMPMPNGNEAIIHTVTDVASVMKVMEELVPQMDIVIHSMAVSDFGFKPISEKLKSNDPEAFIESLKNRIYKTPKILSQIKIWNPNCLLVSFKFEVGLDHDNLIEIARKSMKDNNSDFVVANDKTEMVKNKTHIAYIVNNIDSCEIIAKGKENISNVLYLLLNNKLDERR